MKYIKLFENKKPYYDVNQIKYFIDWYYSNYSYLMEKEGWLISLASLVIPYKYNVSYENRAGDFWQIQRDDEAMILSDFDGDLKAEELAKNAGLLVDDYGVVIGYDNVSFLEQPEKLIFYRDTDKYNL